MNLRSNVVAIACLALLAACTHTITLYPRGGGQQATGWVNDGSKNMEVELAGNKFAGSYVLGTTFGVGFATTGRTTGTGTMFGATNNATALLVGPGGTIRCEFMIVAARGGNGVCVDGNNTLYDMLIK